MDNSKTNLDFLNTTADLAAKKLLGCTLTRQIGNKVIKVRIVETEAYDQFDAASHSYRGSTKRTAVMFGPAGFLYVYFTYGMHYCCNVVIGRSDYGAAALIRAVEPISGLSLMVENRHGRSGIEVSNGPAKVCQALNIDKSLNGQDLRKPPLILEKQPPLPAKNIVVDTRIGISQNKDLAWRFYIKGNSYVSKPNKG
jgi:DNA-3-methyladenine glycosylase